MSGYHPRAVEFARFLRDTREALVDDQGNKVSQRDIPRRGGPSKPSVSRYEMGQIPAVMKPEDMHKIDIGYGLEPGTTQQWLGLVSPGDTVQARADPAPDWSLLRRYVQAVSTMQRALAKEDLPAEVRDAMYEVSTAQTDLLLDMTDQMEK